MDFRLPTQHFDVLYKHSPEHHWYYFTIPLILALGDTYSHSEMALLLKHHRVIHLGSDSDGFNNLGPSHWSRTIQSL